MKHMKETLEVHDELNPKLWGSNNHLKPEVSDKIKEIVDEFIIEIEENDIPIHILDTHIVGSNASYNYTDESDLDVHIIANFEEVTCDPYVLGILYNYFKSYFNDKYDISIHDVDVELYIEDVNTSSISNGIYSLSEDEWIKFPKKVDVPNVDISNEIIKYKNMYDSAINSRDGMEALQLVDDLYLLRRNSLAKDGEYGVGNLIFKEFRNQGWLDNLKKLGNEYKSEKLTLEKLHESLEFISGLSENYLSMDSLINEASGRGVIPDDLFKPYDYLVNAKVFFDYLTSNKDTSYAKNAEDRIHLNKPTNEFYRTLMGYLDSEGLSNNYPKLDPALVKKSNDGKLIPIDGRHRAKLCMLLGIPLPVKLAQLEAIQDCEHNTTVSNKWSRGKRNGKQSRNTTRARHLAPKVINEIVVRTPKWTYNVNESLDMKSIQDYVEDNFSFKTTPPEGQMYIMSDGRFLELGYDGAHIGVDDMLYQDNLIDYDPYDYGHELILVDKFNAVRCSDGKAINANPYIQLPPNKITQAQLDAIMDWLDGLDEDVVYVEGVEYNLNEVTVDYVIKRILRYYSSGVMYETASMNNSQLISLVEKEFGVSSSPVRGPTFLMPDGKFLTIADTFERRNSFEDFPCHAEVQHFLKSHNLTDASGDYTDGSPVLSELGAIRINDIEEENNYIELSPKYPTSSQLESLLRHLDNNSARYRTVIVTDPGMNNFVTYDYGTTITDDIVKNIKRYYTSNILYEDYLDTEQQFWDYKTEKVSGKDIFDINRGESGYASDMVKLAHSGEVDDNGRYAKFVEMSPKEYFEACEKGFGIPAQTQLETVGKHDKDIIKQLEAVIDKYGVKFPVTYLDYSYDKFSQEGRHRMFVAGEKFGWNTKFPVLVINTTEDATNERHIELMNRYISKALQNTERYTFDDFQDIKEQFLYDIERVLSNPNVMFDETDSDYVFIVNGVRYEEPKEEFKFYSPEEREETSIDDIDELDLIDFDDLMSNSDS